MCFFNSDELAYLEQTMPIAKLKYLTFSKYSFQKVTQFSLGNNLVDAPVSNIDGFLSRDTCISSTQVTRPIWKI
jgi:hypothetical protein